MEHEPTDGGGEWKWVKALGPLEDGSGTLQCVSSCCVPGVLL
jgi:hypothetical protein